MTTSSLCCTPPSLCRAAARRFKTEQDIEVLYRDLEQLFDWLQQRTVGMTLAEYYQLKAN